VSQWHPQTPFGSPPPQPLHSPDGPVVVDGPVERPVAGASPAHDLVDTVLDEVADIAVEGSAEHAVPSQLPTMAQLDALSTELDEIDAALARLDSQPFG
jgi:hypothetical protein